MDPTAHHFAVTVSDLDRAIAFYRDTLGLEVLSEFAVGGEAFATGVGIDGASAQFAHLEAGDARIELVEYTPEGERAAETELNQPGANHLGLEVDDLDAVYDSLPESVEPIADPQTTESGTRICFIRDPDGTLLELLEL
ncbi:VOC family protein [Haloarcula laminariae]|uniref:VOC family protein n=1 Tax=Haloarcula laminariae TaxID=2961577 RepID=UPI0021CA2C39|nr:VOC family protein [Halomicroarcula laminariae]